MTALKPLDTQLASVGFKSVSYDPNLRTPYDRKSAIPSTPLSATPSHKSASTKTPLSPGPDKPIFGRRVTTRTFDDSGVVDQTEALAHDGDEDAPTKIGQLLSKIHRASVFTRYSLYVLPAAILLAIPIIVTANPPHDNLRADGIRLLGLFIWIEILWVAIWFSRLIAYILPVVFQAACGLISSGVRKYSLVLHAIQIPMTIFFLTIIAYSTSDIIYIFDKNAYQHQGAGKWVTMVNYVCRTNIIAALIFVGEKTVIQLISMYYYRKQYARKIRESKRLIRLLDLLYDASRKLFPEFGGEFSREDTEIHTTSFIDFRARIEAKKTPAHKSASPSLSAAHSVVSKALQSDDAAKALARRLWLSLCSSGRDAIYREDVLEVLGRDREHEAEEIFAVLDRDGNGDISLEEMTMIVVECGKERRDRATSIQDISSAIAVLDKLLILLVLIVSAFIFATVFSKAFASKTAQLWTSFTGLAFAIGGTVTEFLACCIFLFVKHPYDVGDRVNIEEQELIVKHISLMFSIFKRVDNDAVLQIPHNIANGLWIENITRSKAMKERLRLNISICTTMPDLLALRKEMEKFVNAPENRRDFYPEFDIELTEIIDIKALEIRVEIRHKSNWSNETLRLHRRNKFMIALLTALKKVGIERPGDLPGPDNPTYICQADTTRTKECKAERAEKVSAIKRNAGVENVEREVLVEKGISPAQGLFPGLKKGSGLGEGVEDKGRRPSIWSPL